MQRNLWEKKEPTRMNAVIQNVGMASLPKGLVTEEELAQRVPLSAARIKELTDNGFLPCWVIDGSERLYQVGSVRRWIELNLVSVQEGRQYPNIVPILVERAPLASVPTPLRNAADLLFSVPGAVSGIYFLIRGDKVVYVGKSVSVVARVTQHVNEGVKAFDYALYLPLCEDDHVVAEDAFIKCLKPEYNVANLSRSAERGEQVDEAVAECCAGLGLR
jgi:hypothetical protein